MFVNNKFLICTPGRTASTSLFNYIRGSLYEQSADVTAIDRGAYTSQEMVRLNQSRCAVFTMFNGFKLPHILEDINTQDWCLILLTRNNVADWLLSMIAIHDSNEWHPGKEHKVESFSTSKEIFSYTYWGIKCWYKLVHSQASTFGFNRIVEIDFDDLVKDWPAAGKKINDWEWQVDPKLMRMGMTTSWKAVQNIEEVLTWIPDDDIMLKEQIKQQL